MSVTSNSMIVRADAVVVALSFYCCNVHIGAAVRFSQVAFLQEPNGLGHVLPAHQ